MLTLIDPLTIQFLFRKKLHGNMITIEGQRGPVDSALAWESVADAHALTFVTSGNSYYVFVPQDNDTCFPF